MAQNTRELNVSINVDISEALTALKAIQREAKKATQALRELESASEAEEVGTFRKGDVIDANGVWGRGGNYRCIIADDKRAVFAKYDGIITEVARRS